MEQKYRIYRMVPVGGLVSFREINDKIRQHAETDQGPTYYQALKEHAHPTECFIVEVDGTVKPLS